MEPADARGTGTHALDEVGAVELLVRGANADTIRTRQTIIEDHNLLCAIVSPTHREKQDNHSQALGEGDSEWYRATLTDEVRCVLVHRLQYHNQRPAFAICKR